MIAALRPLRFSSEIGPDRGFTLIELSIVLVIIGLIVGGVLAGRDLISSAAVRAQVTQIERYNTAVNTFRGKYNALPGDISADSAAAFGFLPRGTYPNGGNNNGLIEGYVSGSNGVRQDSEILAFWEDLTTAHLIPEAFNTFTPGTYSLLAAPVRAADIKSYLPAAKIGTNFVYVWNGGASGSDGSNYFGVSISTTFDANGWMPSNTGLTVQQAYAIDKKIDDGFPQSGNVLALYIAGVNFASGDWAGVSPGGTASGSATTCYDNGGNNTNPMLYSVTQNGGAGVNCALSFRFQ